MRPHLNIVAFTSIVVLRPVIGSVVWDNTHRPAALEHNGLRDACAGQPRPVVAVSGGVLSNPISTRAFVGETTTGRMSSDKPTSVKPSPIFTLLPLRTDARPPSAADAEIERVPLSDVLPARTGPADAALATSVCSEIVTST